MASTSGYHSYEPSPFNHRSKRSSVLDPSAVEFQMDNEPVGIPPSSSNRSSYQSEQPFRRSSRSHNPTQQRIATSCKFLGILCERLAV